ncbi:MAG: PQQ-binding-like beta-propeller repeat protein [Dysgonamonadaceae bacterium]|jgi:outer membrane protein assembly factor BamB|nr:PQQ-binding-like beta-propeller repeat protein [Dysgonamonadaceae bacterium]
MKQLFTLSMIFTVFCLHAQDVIQWRGTDRSGVFQETDLMKSWSANSPELLWHFNGLGEGHSSPAIANDKIYVTGMLEDRGYLFIFDLSGNLLNRVFYGKEWDRSYNGARGTPTISDGMIYIHSSIGDLICIDLNTLSVVWRKNMTSDFGGPNIRWGATESPLIIDNKVIFSIGGREHNIVALNKKDGSLIWSSSGRGDASSYCSPLFIANQEVPQIITTMSNYIIGIEAATGKLLWYFPYANFRNIHPNTPVYDGNDMILITNGYDKGSVMLRLTNGGRSILKVWENDNFKSVHGGVVKVGNYAFVGGDDRENNRDGRYRYAINWNTGEVVWRTNDFPQSTIIADGNGMVYFYTTRGDMVLVNGNSNHLEIAGQFRITLGTEQHWAHPVIYKGVLYIRRGDTLMAYKIK